MSISSKGGGEKGTERGMGKRRKEKREKERDEKRKKRKREKARIILAFHGVSRRTERI